MLKYLQADTAGGSLSGSAGQTSKPSEFGSSSRGSGGGGSERARPDMPTVVRLLKSLFAFEERIDSLPLASSCEPLGPNNAPACVLPGDWLLKVLEACDIHVAEVCTDTSPHLTSTLYAVNASLTHGYCHTHIYTHTRRLCREC